MKQTNLLRRCTLLHDWLTHRFALLLKLLRLLELLLLLWLLLWLRLENVKNCEQCCGNTKTITWTTTVR